MQTFAAVFLLCRTVKCGSFGDKLAHSISSSTYQKRCSVLDRRSTYSATHAEYFLTSRVLASYFPLSGVGDCRCSAARSLSTPNHLLSHTSRRL